MNSIEKNLDSWTRFSDLVHELIRGLRSWQSYDDKSIYVTLYPEPNKPVIFQFYRFWDLDENIEMFNKLKDLVYEIEKKLVN